MEKPRYDSKFCLFQNSLPQESWLVSSSSIGFLNLITSLKKGIVGKVRELQELNDIKNVKFMVQCRARVE